MKRSATLIAAAAMIFSAFAAAPASAANWDARSRTVAYADLNLHSEAGARVMLGRMDRAARAACVSLHGPMPLTSRRAINACRTETMTEAVNALNAPMVTAIYYDREPNIIIASR